MNYEAAKMIHSGVALVVVCLCSPAVAVAQHKDLMGGTWNNPTSASISNLINDRIYERMRAKARARRKSGNASSANSRVEETRVSDPEPPKRSAAQTYARRNSKSA